MGLKWRIKACGHIPICCWTFLELLQKFTKDGPMAPLFVTRIQKRNGKKRKLHTFQRFYFYTFPHSGDPKMSKYWTVRDLTTSDRPEDGWTHRTDS